VTDQRSPSDLIAHRFWESVTGEHHTRRSEIRYFGVVKRIPFAAFPRTSGRLETMAMEWDESVDSVRADLPPTLPVSMQGWEPVPDCSVERYEAFDREAGDLLVFWRIPCRRRG
jgi:hypothetical protein